VLTQGLKLRSGERTCLVQAHCLHSHRGDHLGYLTIEALQLCFDLADRPPPISLSHLPPQGLDSSTEAPLAVNGSHQVLSLLPEHL
jgi:hypothetical protein